MVNRRYLTSGGGDSKIVRYDCVSGAGGGILVHAIE